MVRFGSGPDHPLHGEAAIDEVAVRGDVHVLEVIQQRRTLVPGHVQRTLDDVLTVNGRDRDECDVGDLEPRAELAEILLDVIERALAVVDQVHLVDAYDQVPDPEQRRDEGVTARLLHDAVAGVDEDHGEVGGRRARDHVAGVALVARRVGDDELAPGGLKVPVGDVDRDALLALGAQAVGQERQIEGTASVASLRGQLKGFQLIAEDLLRVVEQPADQRALAVVDGAGDDQAEHLRARLDCSAAVCVAGLGCGSASQPSEVSRSLAILHRRFREAVVRSRLAPLGQLRPRDLGDHLVERLRG